VVGLNSIRFNTRTFKCNLNVTVNRRMLKTFQRHCQ